MSEAMDEGVIAYLKQHGMYEAIAVQANKGQPDAGDVHAPAAAAGKGKRKKKPMLPVATEDDEEDQSESVSKEEAAEFSLAVDITKVDQVQQMIFGWASVSSVSGEDIIDKQGDVIPIGSLEKGVYDYVLYSREHGDMHSKVGSGKLIESMVFTPEKASAGIAAKNDNGEPMMGWWVGFKVNDKPTWDAIASGDRPELSIGGRATSVEKGYNDDEPRDDHGRWSDGGGGGESRSPGRDASKPRGDGSVDDYVSRLEASVHNANAFPALHGELAHDENLSVNDVKSINRQFTGNRATSKAQALKQIWSAHQEVMTTRARALATAGRTAA